MSEEVKQEVEQDEELNVSELELLLNRMEPIVNRALAGGRMSERRSHSGNRNYDKQLGYTIDVDESEIWTRYERSPELQRAVNKIPDTSWGRVPTVSVDGDTENPFVEAFNKFAKEHGLWKVLKQADKLSRLYRYAIIVIGYRDGMPGDLLTPNNVTSPLNVPGLPKENKVLYLTAYGSADVSINKWEKDRFNKRYRLPLTYQLIERELAEGQSGDSQNVRNDVTVHHSRVLHIAYDAVRSKVYGTPVSIKIWDVLDDILKGVSGAIEGTWRIAVAQKMLLKLKDGVAWARDPSSDNYSKQSQALSDRLDRMIHNMTSALVASDIEDIENLQGDPVDPTAIAEVSWKRIAMTIDTPMNIYMGSQSGELASTQDMTSWISTVVHEQYTQNEANILMPLIQDLIDNEILPDPGGEVRIGQWDAELEAWVWPMPILRDPQQDAKIMEARARAIRMYQEARNSGAVITDNEIRHAANLKEMDDPQIELEVQKQNERMAARMRQENANAEDPDEGDEGDNQESDLDAREEGAGEGD